MDIKTIKNITGFRSRPLIFLDLETTGLWPQKHEILEIGALKVESKKPFNILAEISIKVKPLNLKLADQGALKIVKFTEEEWRDGISIEKALTELDKFSEGGVLVGYNVSFDWSFLDKAYSKQGRVDPFHYHRIDVMSMSYLKLYKKKLIKKFGLSDVSEHFGIKRAVVHRALDDALTTYLVFKKLFAIK